MNATQTIKTYRDLFTAAHPVRRNVVLLNLFAILRNAVFVLPILVPFYNHIGLTFQQFLIGEAAFAAVMVLMEVPSGWVADLWQRKLTIAVGVLIDALALFMLMIADSFWMTVAAQATMGVGLSLSTGTVSALLYDSLAAYRLQGKFRQLEGFRHGLGMYAVGGASLVGGFLYQIDPHLPFVFDIAGCALAAVCALLVVEPARIKEEVHGNALLDMAQTLKYAFHGHKEVACIILFMAVLFGTTQAGMWTQQPYYIALGLSEAWFGVFTAIGFLLSGLAGQYGHVLERRARDGKILPLIWLGVTICYTASGFALGYHAIALLFCSSISYGLTFPIIQDAINRRVASARRATIISAANLAARFVFIPLSFVIGGIADTYGITNALLVLSVFLLTGGSFGIACLKKHGLC